MDDRVIGFSRASLSISEQLDLVEEKPAIPAIEAEDDDFPGPGDEYAATGRISNKAEEMIAFLLRDQSEEVFSYAGLERVRLLPAVEPGQGMTLVLRFNGSVVIEARIEGRNLRALVPSLRRQRVPWMRETPMPGDFAARSATVITRIVVEEVVR